MAAAPPVEMTVGAPPATVTVLSRITNAGPSAPMDVRVQHAAAATPSGTVTPAAGSGLEAALGHHEARTVERAYEVACATGGPATFTFSSEIAPDRPDDVDPDPANDRRQDSFTVECIIPVAINIHPGSFENPVNIRSRNGNVPVPTATRTWSPGSGRRRRG